MNSKFNIGNAVSHEKYGDGIVISGGSTYLVKFETGLKTCTKDELKSNPKKAKYVTFKRGGHITY
jgi:hypothetical protein